MKPLIPIPCYNKFEIFYAASFNKKIKSNNLVEI